MSPRPSDHQKPPVLKHAALDDDNRTVQALYDAIKQLNDQERADYLGVARWNCPFGCGTHSETVAGIRRHITRISEGDHAHEAGRTPSKPIPGFSIDGDGIAIITAADTPEHSRVLPGQPDPDSPEPVVPLTPSTAEAITDPVTKLRPRPAPHKGPVEPLALDETTHDRLRLGDTYTRWVCGLCGDFTADSAEELNGHIHARTDDIHSDPETVRLAGLLMGVDQQVYAVLQYDETTPRIAPPPRGGSTQESRCHPTGS